MNLPSRPSIHPSGEATIFSTSHGQSVVSTGLLAAVFLVATHCSPPHTKTAARRLIHQLLNGNTRLLPYSTLYWKQTKHSPLFSTRCLGPAARSCSPTLYFPLASRWPCQWPSRGAGISVDGPGRKEQPDSRILDNLVPRQERPWERDGLLELRLPHLVQSLLLADDARLDFPHFFAELLLEAEQARLAWSRGKGTKYEFCSPIHERVTTEHEVWGTTGARLGYKRSTTELRLNSKWLQPHHHSGTSCTRMKCD